ncbi:MAG: hypothetical protein A2Y57_02790 [Candidatus Woykebacteria bacterium RBG_13_40_7b]|uniref:DUF3352 domain-containing protein n=1 Tax=Candidatus Woykebacteria bacterium RBG_13_40_7b TaxID=1802594 RepID=A0A1G1WBS2_9BACT|nr:MAG: hypothetical protein A2Y57_02790 [Candidatus Woykebacteria bacterium RBG_13_40_7b]
MLKIHFSKYSFVYFLFLISLSIGIIFFLKPYGKTFSSYAYIEEEGESLKIDFKLTKNDQKALQALAKKISLDWSGEGLVMDLNVNRPIFNYLDGLQLGLKPKSNSLEFNFKKESILNAKEELSWNYTAFTPREAFFYLEYDSLKEFLKFPGSETLGSLKNFALIGIRGENDLEFAVVGEAKVKDNLQTALLNLKKLASPNLNYIEGSFNDIKLITLFSSLDKAGYTIGADQKFLIIASSPQAWINIYQTKNGQDNVSKNPNFIASKLDLPKKGILNLFVNFGEVYQFGVSNLEGALKQYFSLEINPELQKSSILSNLSSLSLVFKNSYEAYGAILLK